MKNLLRVIDGKSILDEGEVGRWLSTMLLQSLENRNLVSPVNTKATVNL